MREGEEGGGEGERKGGRGRHTWKHTSRYALAGSNICAQGRARGVMGRRREREREREREGGGSSDTRETGEDGGGGGREGGMEGSLSDWYIYAFHVYVHVFVCLCMLPPCVQGASPCVFCGKGLTDSRGKASPPKTPCQTSCVRVAACRDLMTSVLLAVIGSLAFLKRSRADGCLAPMAKDFPPTACPPCDGRTSATAESEAASAPPCPCLPPCSACDEPSRCEGTRAPALGCTRRHCPRTSA